MNYVSQESLNISEPLLSENIANNKSRDNEFYDFSENPASIFHSFEQISKSCIFKSFSDDKQTLHSDKSIKPLFSGSTQNNKSCINDKKKKGSPLKSIADNEENFKNIRFLKSINEDVFKSIVADKYENNFQEPNKLEKRKSYLFDELNSNIIMITTPRIDLTNRFINLLSQNFYFRGLYFLMTLLNIAFRIYLMEYFYEIYIRGFEMGSLYLCFFYIPRICYMLSMIKILFHVNEEEIYIERMSFAFNSFDEISIKSWNNQLNYDYEINMNNFFGRKRNLIKKWRKKPFIVDYKTTLKAFLKRIIIVLIPVETTLLFFKLIYKGTKVNSKSFIKLFLVANWIYQCYECLLLIPCIFCLYFLEGKFNLYWIFGANSDSLAFVIQLWEVFQFLALSVVLSIFNFENVERGAFEFQKFF